MWNGETHFSPSSFDSEIFDCRVCRVHVSAPEHVESLKRLAEGKQYDLAFVLTEDLAKIGEICNAGWDVGAIDLRYDFEKPEVGLGLKPIDPIRPVRDAQLITKLAEKAFLGGRFYKDKAMAGLEGKLYRRWIENSVRDNLVWGYWDAGRPVGLIAFRHKDMKIGRCELIAVEPEYRSRGIGEALMRAFEQSLPAKCTSWVKTSCDNTRAVKFYLRLGYKISKVEAMLDLRIQASPIVSANTSAMGEELEAVS